MSEPKYIFRKGGTVLLYRGHQYYKNCVYKNATSLWRCSSYKKLKCRGCITMKDETVVKVVTHQCPSSEEKNYVDSAMADLKDSVAKSDVSIPNLYNEAVGTLLDHGMHLVTHVPQFRNVQHGLYNARNKSLGVKKLLCKKADQIQVPTKFSNFILADYSCDNNRIIIFCSYESRVLIRGIIEIFFDATYQSCPKPFYQLLSVHGEIDSSIERTNVIPLLFVLMNNKTQASYEIVFTLLQKNLSWNPLIVHCDYERAAINAATKIFPGVTLVGCYYHWSRCVWRKAKSLGYTKSAVDRRIIALCSRLPLLPDERIIEGWNYIKSEATTEMNDFFTYFERNWINSALRQYISVYGHRHRTNNSVESWNSKINRAINKSTVNILRLLNYLEKLDKETHIKTKKNDNKKRKREDVDKDNAILNIQLQLINEDIVLGHALEKLANIK